MKILKRRWETQGAVHVEMLEYTTNIKEIEKYIKKYKKNLKKLIEKMEV